MTSTIDEIRPSGPRLPQELIDLVLRNVDDEAWLWVVGRQVSHKIRKETERIFLEGLLKDTEVMTNVLQFDFWSGLRYRCPFSRVSADGATAFFSTNNTTLTEITLPNLQFHRSTAEVSFDWKSLFTALYREQLTITELKQQNGKPYAAIERLPTSRPLVMRLRNIERVPELDSNRFEEECEVLRPRFASYLNDAGCPLDGVDTLIKRVQNELKTLTFWMQMNELICKYDLQRAVCRGQMYCVEDPGSWGWKEHNPWDPTMEPRWYNNAWEDPDDGGRTTISEDALVLEVESMARAWEKGLA
ncbi:hypothetical protein FB567DRAFT_576264 [Paraphoma chrysanthemicola]|uniref:Uncharacterized protein n=1 Tax=Paraphoma chrysanthemicola TaxID=798071 RepID=A0A8K0RGG6_9PLEO|nr:hypothetical protein FB567DRAFT_576264 [Paraphoma chrysanthemicola]